MSNLTNNTSSSRIKQLKKIANEDHICLPAFQEYVREENSHSFCNLDAENTKIIID